MITAEQTLIQACRDAGFTDDYSKMIFKINPDSSSAYVEAIKEYAKKAIIEDRKNILKNVEEICEIGQYYHASDYENGTPDEFEYPTINENKLNNLPFPELK